MITCVKAKDLQEGKTYRPHQYPGEPFCKLISKKEKGSSDGLVLEFEGRRYFYAYPPYDLLFDQLNTCWKERIQE